MDTLTITGRHRLTGTLRVSGAKNAALPALAAGLLTDDAITLGRVPRVADTDTMLDLLACLGVEHERLVASLRLLPVTRLDARGAGAFELMRAIRASILVLGPLVARRGRARIALPGGCAIGTRPIDEHLRGLTALGAEVRVSPGVVEVDAPSRLRGGRFRFSTPSVTGTENLLMAATLAEGTSILEGCAREPEIADLVRLLTAMGADVEESAAGTFVVRGVAELGGAHHSIIPDRIEAGTYLIGAVMTGGDLRVEGAVATDLSYLLALLGEAGAGIEIQGSSIRAWRDGSLRPHDVVTAPHPGFPTDLQAQYMALMTQAEGLSTVREEIFENRFQHVPELERMGADIRVLGNRAEIRGRSSLRGRTVVATDLRASACLVLAGLAADGETVVRRIDHLDRGYESMDAKLRALGARIERRRWPDHAARPEAARTMPARWLRREGDLVEGTAVAVEVAQR